MLHNLAICASLLFTLTAAQNSLPDTAQQDFWTSIDLTKLDYQPVVEKPEHPPEIVGQALKRKLVSGQQSLAAWLIKPTQQQTQASKRLFRNLDYVGVLNKTHRVLYFKPTKTAGTTLWRGWLEPAICPPKTPEDFQIPENASAASRIPRDRTCQGGIALHRTFAMSPDEWQGLWKSSLVFASVRHPLTRAVSSYNYLVPKVKQAMELLAKQPGWTEFCEDPLVFARACYTCQTKHSPEECNCKVSALVEHVGQQHIGMSDPNRPHVLLLDHVVRTEHLQEDANTLCQALNNHTTLNLNCTVTLHLNPSKEVDLSEMYTGDAAHCLPSIIRYYCWDFVYLNVPLTFQDGHQMLIPPSYCDR